MRGDQPVGEQLQAQVGVIRVRGRGIQIRDGSLHHHPAHTAILIRPGQRGELRGRLLRIDVPGARLRSVLRVKLGSRVPGIQHGSIGGHSGHTKAISRSHGLEPT